MHENCRKTFLKETGAHKISSENLSSSRSEFIFEENCLFCGEHAEFLPNGKSKQTVFHVKKLQFRETIIRIINERKDDWAQEVRLRIQNEADLVAVKAIYHQQCNVNFRTNRNIPNTENKSAKKGAPINVPLQNSFLRLVEFLEISHEPYSTSELTEKFKEFSEGETYTVRYLKNKLTTHFGDRILFLSRNGLTDLVVMRETSEQIIKKYYEEKGKSTADVVMESAAKIVLDDIDAIENNKDAYPSPAEIASEDKGLAFIPQSLTTFLKNLFGQKKTNENKKIISFGHGIIQACRPRKLLAPLQFALGVQIHYFTGSR